MNKKNLEKLINEALAIEAEDAREAGRLGFMARAMVQATMPHKRVDGNEFTRVNGKFTLNMVAPSAVGLPYGNIPRLLMAWLTTEAVRTRERELELGHNLSDFMRQLDMVPTGGRWGSITRLKDQVQRLFRTMVSLSYEDDEKSAAINHMIAERSVLWWDPKQPGQGALWESTVTLTHSFFDEIINNPVPIDMGALKALRRSPMALDIYCWLTYRNSYLRRKTFVPWEALQMQFGADYQDTRQGRYNFREAFKKHLKAVEVVYSGAKVDEETNGLALLPGKAHIPPLGR